MSYIGNSPGVASQRVTTTLTATAGQTQFTAQSGYVLGYVDVYLNGAKLVNGADFEAITGTFITLFEAALAGDVVELISYVPRGLSDGYTKAEADAKFLDVGGDTASGNLAFATASLTGNLTLNGGTANGVAYLNGSKVVTTGSGLQFDGSNLGIGTAPTSTNKLTVFGEHVAGRSHVAIRTSNSSVGTPAIIGFYNSADTRVGSVGHNMGTSLAVTTHESVPIIFNIADTERARISSAGNLGIGTGSPNVRTEISGTEAIVALRVNTENIGNSASNYSEIQLSDNGAVRSYWRNVRDGSGATIFSYNDHLRFAYQGSERARITSSGVFQIANGGALNLTTTASGNGNISFDGSTFTLVSNSSSASMVFSTNSTERARITSGGNLGIGDTSPAETLTVRNTSGRVSIFMASGVTNQGYISYFNSTQTLSLGSAAPTGTGVNGGQQLNITNQGYVGIGITNPSNPLHVYSSVTPPGSIIAKFETASDSWVQIKGGNAAGRSSWQIGATSSGLDFYNDDTTGYRVTISNSGLFGIGTRSPSMPLHVVGGSNVFAFTGSSSNSLLGGVDTLGFYIEQGGGSGNAQAVRIQTSNGSNSYTGIRLDGANRAITFQTSSAQRMSIDSTGAVGFGVGTGGPSLTIESTNSGAANHSHTFSGPSAGTNDDLVFNLNRNGGAYGSFVVRFQGSNALYLPGASLANNGRAYINPPTSLGIGTTSPTTNSKLDVNGPIKSGRTVYNWYSWGGNPSGRYHHIKTSMWGGPGGTNSQPTMSLFHIRGYSYDAHTIDAMIGFHNWSGAPYNLRVSNSGSYAGAHGAYVSTDGYIVLVIDTTTNYPGISIDHFQSFPYGYVDVTVTAASSSGSATGVY